MTITSNLQKDPLSTCVYPHSLKEFLDVIGAGTLIATKGRCIHVRRKSGAFPSFAELAVDLIGWNKPCDEFRVAGSNLYARLKTIGQRCADNAAGEIDAAFGEFGLSEAMAGITTNGLGNLDTEIKPARAASRKAKNKAPAGAATSVMKAMESIAPRGAVDISKLVTASIKLLPVSKDARGQDRRGDYAARAVRKLVELELLFVHGDGEQVSLSPLVTGDA